MVVSIDQGEELFLAEALQEATPFLALLRDLLTEDAPALIALIAIRSDNLGPKRKELEGTMTAPATESPAQRNSDLIWLQDYLVKTSHDAKTRAAAPLRS